MSDPTRAATAAQTPPDQQTVASPGVPSVGSTHTAVSIFVVGRELGRGGMGVVFEATDTELGREVALKTLRPEYATAGHAARFLDEARITARLAHPGIPPIYRTGALPDGRPFLAMKLIRGRTLAELLADNPPLEDRLSAFEQVCLAVGYAHGRGVIHRDLKPANVMVGAFGEVQVMDWGLAKVLGEAATAPLPEPRESNAQETRAGEAMGTPAFMPPEQARGAWQEVDERADVFALGGVLAVLLTGAPPYTGATTRAVLARAEAGELAECFARLDGCGADADLIGLAKWCLSAQRAARPANAGAVAEAVAAHRAGVRAKLAAAETARAAAEVEAREQKRRRRVQLALAAALALLVAGSAGVALAESVRAERARTEEARREAERLRTEGDRDRAERDRAAVLGRNRERVPELLTQAAEQRRRYLFAPAERTLASAAQLAADLPDLAARVTQTRADLSFVRELDTIRGRKWVRVFPDAKPGTWPRTLDFFDTASAPPAYRRAFAGRGLDPDAPADELATRVRASEVRAELVAALDDWSVFEPDPARAERLLSALRAVDPGAWLDRFRTGAVRGSQRELRALSAELPGGVVPHVYVCLAELMYRQELDPGAVLAVGTRRFPGDFDLTFARGLAPQRLAELRRYWGPVRSEIVALASAALGPFERPRPAPPPVPRERAVAVPPRAPGGLSITVRRPSGVDGLTAEELYDSVGFLRVAFAARPDNPFVAYNLGNVLAKLEDDGEALAAFRVALAADPNFLAAHMNVGEVYRRRQMWAEVADTYAKVYALAPEFPGYAVFNRGEALERMGDRDGMLRAQREAAELKPGDANARNNCANELASRGRVKEAVAEFRAALALKPDHDLALPALGGLLFRTKDFKGAAEIYERWVRAKPASDSYCALAEAHLRAGNPTRAAEVLNEAIEKQIDTADVRCGLGDIMRARNLWQLAVRQYIEAARRDPNSVRAFGALGDLYLRSGDWANVALVFQRITELSPNDPGAFNILGVARFRTEKFAESAKAYRTAIALDPSHAPFYDNLGLALLNEGDAAWARWAFERAVEIDPKLFTAHNNRGLCLLDADEFDAAVKAFRTSVELQPKYARAHYNLGFALHRFGDLPGATAAYTAAANADPTAFGHLKTWLPLKAALAPDPRAKKPNP